MLEFQTTMLIPCLLALMQLAVLQVRCQHPYLGQGTFYSPSAGEGSFGPPLVELPSYHPGAESAISSHFSAQIPFKSDKDNLPVYTENPVTPSRESYNPPEKDQYRVSDYLRSEQNPSNFQRRLPRFHGEPFSASSNVDENRNEAFNGGFRSGAEASFNSARPVQVQTGFVPIFKDKNAQRPQSSLIRELEPPILTADNLPSRPVEFKVSASVQSSRNVSTNNYRPTRNGPPNNGGNSRTRPTNYSRFLDLNNGTTQLGVSSSSSERVVSRVISPNSERNKKQGDLQRISASIAEDQKIAAKKVLDISCDGSRDLGWCELGEKYPKKYVDQVVASCPDVVERMHIEIPHNYEKLSELSNFKSELNISVYKEARQRGNQDAWSWASYVQQGSLCDAETGFLRPETAKDTTGKWNIIVQTDAIRQRVPLEMCRKTNSPCKKMVVCGLKSQCLQKYNYHLLLSLNPVQKHDCPFMKLYRFPSACVCHVE